MFGRRVAAGRAGGPEEVIRPEGRFLPAVARGSMRQGARVMAPAAVAIASWGVVTGVAMVKAGMPLAVALVMTFTVFAGSAQLAVMPLLVAGAPLPVVLVTAAIVNLRFVIFSAAARPFFEHLPLGKRTLVNYLNGDLPFALFMRAIGDDPARGTPHQLGVYLGIAFTNWTSWQVASVTGFLLGGAVPSSWGLGLAAVLALLGVVIPMSGTRPALAGVLVAGSVAIALVHAPMKLGLLAAVVAGVAVALTLERISEGPA